MKTIFLYIPHFVFSSDLLRTDYIKILSQKFRVVVFSPIFLTNSAADYYQHPNIEYVGVDAEHPRFWFFMTRTLRISMIREFDGLEYYKLRRLTKANLNWQRNLLRKISWFIPRPFLTVDFFTKLENWLLPSFPNFENYINKYKPSLLVTCTPGLNAVEAEAIVMAKKNGLNSVAINSSWDNYTSNATQFRKTDYLIGWNPVMKEEAIKIHGYLPGNVFVSGVYRFDHHFTEKEGGLSKEDFLKSKNLDPNLKTLFLCTLPPNTYPPQYQIWPKIVEMRNKKEFAEDLNILIRIHPNDRPERYDQFRGVKNLHVDLAGKSRSPIISTGHRIEMDEEDLANLRYSLKYTDVNINFRSSLTLEATIYNKPVINLALEGYANRYKVDWYQPIIESRGVKLVEDWPDLKNAINLYLRSPREDSAGREKIFEDYVVFKDGRTPERCVEFIEEIVGKDNE